MATRKKKSYNSTSRRSVSQSKSKQGRAGRSVLSSLRDSKIGRIILIAICTLCVLVLNYLITLNQFDRFFLFVGVELIVVVLFCWIRFVLRGRSDDKD